LGAKTRQETIDESEREMIDESERVMIEPTWSPNADKTPSTGQGATLDAASHCVVGATAKRSLKSPLLRVMMPHAKQLPFTSALPGSRSC
jgi:hypothetical protein